MFSARNLSRALFIALPLLFAGNAHGFVVDDDVPDVTGRVARISYLGGEVLVRRGGSQDWEKAVLNLPVVEGDELATSDDARIEIQFDTKTFVRVEENSVMRIVTLKDEGVALSVPEGSISLRLNEFDTDRSFFEIDIPNTTIAIQRAGLYRVDSGPRNSAEARIRVTDGGEARVYSDTSGFTLRDGRMATIYLSGRNVGEWNTADASRFSDEFDNWTLDRDTVIAKRLRDAYYDKYYDRDIYGAEDLTDHGEWIYTRKYGYVWRPFRTSIAGYADWSPYRYGHWRWIPPYGWTWINDEPWGWATYHHGRWVWDNGHWYWTPYGYYRYRRSWWQPALVVITIFNNNVCWYPLGYRHRYYNYNRHHGWRGGRNNNSPGPVATPTPNAGPTQAQINEERRRRMHTPPLSDVPPGGVITVPAEQFGRRAAGAKRAPLEVAKTVLSKDPEELPGTPILPQFEQVRSQVTKEIRAEAPPIIARADTPVRTGAAERKTDKPLDEDLKRSRMFGNRPPLVIENPPASTSAPTTRDEQQPRKTGAVDRPVFVPRDQTPRTDTTPPILDQPSRRDDRKVEAPQRPEPTYEPPKRRQPTLDPGPRTEAPRSEPPPRRESPKSDPPPTRESPKSDPQPSRQQPPPQKSEPAPQPKQDQPPAPAPERSSPKKDGR